MDNSITYLSKFDVEWENIPIPNVTRSLICVNCDKLPLYTYARSLQVIILIHVGDYILASKYTETDNYALFTIVIVQVMRSNFIN